MTKIHLLGVRADFNFSQTFESSESCEHFQILDELELPKREDDEKSSSSR